MNYTQPHYVILQFCRGFLYHEKKDTLMAQAHYYRALHEEGKVLMQGNLLNQEGAVLIVRVSSDTELEELINDDPAVQARAAAVLKAIPFVPQSLLKKSALL